MYCLAFIKKKKLCLADLQYTFLRCLEITPLHFSRRACFMLLRDTGDCGFCSSPSFGFFGSFVSLAISEKSEIEYNKNRMI